MTTILKFFFWSDSTKGMAKVRLVGISLLVSFSFFSLVSIDLVFVMNLSWDGVTLRFLDSLVFVVKCTHRGCKILVQCIFLFCSKNQTISKQRAYRAIPMWSFEANDNGFAKFFFLKMCIWFTTCKCSYRDYLNCYHNWQDLWKNVAVFLYAKY